MLLHEYLKRSVCSRKEKPAIISKDQSISYHELEMHSNKIANLLVSSGIAQHSNIGLYMNKSIAAVASIFGILKAGAAYVPLDPDSPIERTAFIISDCRLKTIIADDRREVNLKKNSSLLPSDLTIVSQSPPQPSAPYPSSWKRLGLSEMNSQPADLVIEREISEDDLAYILYTSGSTGQPKGVMLSHKNAGVFVEWAGRELNLTETDIFSSHAPFHFDLSVFDIYVSIKVGGTLCLIPPGISYFPEEILTFIRSSNITVWYSVPSAISQILSTNDLLSEKLQSISTLIYAGEVFPYQHLNQLRNCLPLSSSIYNWYGPTETNVITSFKVESDRSHPLQKNAPIGKACPYANIYVLDNNYRPVQDGEVGELAVQGDSVMKGYWGNPEKTSLSLRHLSVPELPEGFYYFTGDLVYRNAHGDLEFVNRRDNMVKIRGFRVELGEIEAALFKNTNVHQAAVVAVPDRISGNQLYAFISLTKGASLSEEELDKWYSRLLPVYMIPKKSFFLDQLPATSTGKINREKLKEITGQRRS